MFSYHSCHKEAISMNSYDLELQAKAHLARLHHEAQQRQGGRRPRFGRAIGRWLHALADRLESHPSTVQRTA